MQKQKVFIALATLAVLIVGFSIFGQGRFFKGEFDIDGKGALETCERYLAVYELGDWTDRYGTNDILSACLYEHYYTEGVWLDSPWDVDSGSCTDLVVLWNNEDWTGRFGAADKYLTCDEEFTDDPWKNPSEARCDRVLQVWSFGGWSERYGEPSDDPRYNPGATPDELVSCLIADDFETTFPAHSGDLIFDACDSIRTYWREQDWTGRFGGTPSYLTCELPEFTRHGPIAGYEDVVVTEDLPDGTKNPFSDVNPDTLEGKAAIALYLRGIVGGFPDGTFKGEQGVNRAEAAKFLLLAGGYYVPDGLRNDGYFADVKEKQWYTKYVVQANREGIIKGDDRVEESLRTFRPGDGVNTVEFIAMIQRALHLETEWHHEFTDINPTECAWWCDLAGIAWNYNLFPSRIAERELRKNDALTRNEVVVAIYQALKALDEDDPPIISAAWPVFSNDSFSLGSTVMPGRAIKALQFSITAGDAATRIDSMKLAINGFIDSDRLSNLQLTYHVSGDPTGSILRTVVNPSWDIVTLSDLDWDLTPGETVIGTFLIDIVAGTTSSPSVVDFSLEGFGATVNGDSAVIGLLPGYINHTLTVN